MTDGERWAFYWTCVLCTVLAALLSQVSSPRYEPVFAAVAILGTLALLGLYYLYRSNRTWRWRIAVPAVLAGLALLDVALRYFAQMRLGDLL